MEKKILIRYRNFFMKSIIVSLVLFSLFIAYDKVHAAQIKFSISYNANGGSGAPERQFKEKGKSIILSSKKPVRKGYEFSGWAITKTSTTVSYRPGSRYSNDKSIVLFAVWKPDKYKIFYNANGGSSAPSSQEKIHDKTLQLTESVPKRTGYNFLGWSKSKTASSASYKPGGFFYDNKNTTLYAVWKIKTYKINYNPNGGSGTPESQTKKYGQSILLRSMKPTRSGYAFVGWSEDRNSTIAQYKAGGKYSANRSILLYAVWFRVEYKITYHANGGNISVHSQTKKWNNDLLLSKSVPRRNGYTFLGWTLTENATDIKYYPGDMYKTNKSIDLYALWGKTKTKKFEDTHALISIGSGVGTVKATCIYTEDYKKKADKISFYNHTTYLILNLSKLNDKENFTVYAPKVVTHRDAGGKELHHFVVNKKVDTMEKADYKFSFANRKKVTYDVGKEVNGSCGFFVKFGPDTWTPPAVKMRLCSEKKQVRNVMVAENDTEYYYSLGEIEGKLENKEQTTYNFKYSSPQIKKQPNQNNTRKLLAKGKNSMVYDTDIEGYIAEKQLSGAVTYQDVKDIVKRILEEKELDCKAEDYGCEKSKEEAENYIKELRTELKEVDNYDEYLAFIAGTGMNEEVYWQTKVESYRRQLMRNEYMEKMYHEFLSGKENLISEEGSGMAGQEKAQIKEDSQRKIDFMRDLRENIIKESEIEIIGNLGLYIRSN